MIRRMTAAFTAVLLFVMPVKALAAVPVDGAYGSDEEELEEAYETAYGWDRDKMEAYSWTGDDGREYARKSSGFQLKEFDDANDAMVQQLTDQGYELDLSGGRKGLNSTGGAGIVAVALAEVGADRSYEEPLGSNNVFYNTWFYGGEVSGDAYQWCCVFVSWCADQCGYLSSEGSGMPLFTRTGWCKTEYDYLISQGFESYPMSDIRQCGGSYSPVPGDIVFWYNAGSSSAPFGHIGICTASTESTITITQGNCCDKVLSVEYSASSITGSLRTGFIVHVEYPGFSFGDAEIQDTVYLFCTMELGMSPAGACGVMANIESECGWDIQSTGDSGSSYGLCQWHNTDWIAGASGTGRWKNLIVFCDGNGLDWTTLEGQLRFLQYELSSYSSMMEQLRSMPDSLDGARNAAYIWASQFECCVASSYPARQANAVTYWNQYGNR